MRQFSNSELVGMLQASQLVLAECDRRVQAAYNELDDTNYVMWCRRKKQFQEAIDRLYDELGMRLLDATEITWEVPVGV